MTIIANSGLSDLSAPSLLNANAQSLTSIEAPMPLTVDAEVSRYDVETPQDKGERSLARLYGQALKGSSSAGQDPQKVMVNDIPPTSSFGQLRAQLDNILNSPAFKAWAAEKGLDLSQGVTLDAGNGTIITKRPPRALAIVPETRTQAIDIHSFVGWPLLKNVAKALAGSDGVIKFDTATTASIADIARFYGHSLPFDPSLSSSEQEATIADYVAGWDRKGTLISDTSSLPSKEDVDRHAAQLGDLNNRTTVIAVIPQLADDAAKGISDDLNEARQTPNISEDEYLEASKRSKQQRMQVALDTAIEIDPASSYFREHNLKPGVAVTLRDYLVGHGLLIPTEPSELKAIAESLASPLPETPRHGDMGGALSWPTLLSNQDQRRLGTVIEDVLKDQPEDNLLDYLTRDLSWDEKTLKEDPRRAFDDILKSSNAQNLGQAAEREIGEIASPEPINDWVLAALYVSLDKQSVSTDPSVSTRTNIAGFDMNSVSGRSASYIRAALADYLIQNGIATAQTVDIALFVLLSRKAPELLVKDIPETLLKGTHAWVSFTTAVARIEALAPGSTSKMTYLQIMMLHELAPITLIGKLIEQRAQNNGVKDWGLESGLLDRRSDDEYPPTQMDELRFKFSQQVYELNNASTTFAMETPDLHKWALAEIKSQNPHLSEEQIKSKSISANDSGILESLGPYSLLDIFINNRDYFNDLDLSNYTSEDKDIDLSKVVINPGSRAEVRSRFETQMELYFNRFKAATQAQTKYLISKLPVEDRAIIEHGKISVAKEVVVTQGNFEGTEKTEPSGGAIVVRSDFEDRDGNKSTHTYEINMTTNTVKKRDDLNDRTVEPLPEHFRAGTQSTYLEPVVPDGDVKADLLEASTPNDVNPNSYFSEKTQYIADAMVKSINIEGLEEELRGQTTFDTEVPFWVKAEGFARSLIPGYNGINNFIEGKWREGILDLSFDVFSFLLAGSIGGAAKGTGTVAAGAANVSGRELLANGVKKLVRGAIGALNPIDPSLPLVGVQLGLEYLDKLARTGDKKSLKPYFNYDVIKTFRDVDNATIGKARMQNEIEDVAATQKNGKWYALDPVSKQPYGLPLKDFVPSA